MTWCVYHLIHVTTPHRHLPKLVITDVPDGSRVETDTLERAGYVFSEFGMPWANHVLCRVDADSPADLVGRIRRGEGDRLTYAELVAQAAAPIE